TFKNAPRAIPLVCWLVPAAETCELRRYEAAQLSFTRSKGTSPLFPPPHQMYQVNPGSSRAQAEWTSKKDVSNGCQPGESLSRKAKEKRDAFIKRIKDVKTSYGHDFKEKRDEDFPDPDEADNNDGGSLHSEQTDRDDENAYDGLQQAPPVAAQELPSILKSGYLEKRRKDKQQKGEFNMVGYSIKMNNTLRKDVKRDCCFEISAPDKRVYQFCATSEKEAKEWVEQIDFLIKDMGGVIPEDEEEYDDCLTVTQSSMAVHPVDEIYEELPEEDIAQPPKPTVSLVNKPPVTAVNKSTDYANYFQGLWDCTGEQPDELSFKRGDTIYILSKEYDIYGWWVGEMKGVIGIVPKEYLMELYVLFCWMSAQKKVKLDVWRNSSSAL
ncbi:hypothetical protein DNTS_010847, partial [Danionella cerebrum]